VAELAKIRDDAAGRPTPGSERLDQAAAVDERRTSSVELFWDLVFVFAVTQVTTLLSRHLTWAGFGRGMLVLSPDASDRIGVHLHHGSLDP
jgi:Bacterial low temperature requirement A protein (LtrA)